MGSPAFIEYINLDILLGFITFYIVPLNTLFLLCLADIDKFVAFSIILLIK